MERGAAALVGVEVGFPVVIKLGTKTHTFTVVGLYGREPGPGWEPQNPTLYIPVTYLEKIRTKYILLRRILVRFEEGVEVTSFADEVELAGELLGAGLWRAVSDGEVEGYLIVGWASWNVSVSEAQARKKRGARLGNHNRYQHSGGLDDCPICSPDENVSPGGSLSSLTDRLPIASVLASPRDETRRDETRPPPSSTVFPRPAAADDDEGERDDAQTVIDHLGILGAAANAGERRTIERALERGWTLDQLHDKARAASTAGNPRAYLRTSLNEAANTRPPPTAPKPPSEGMSPPIGKQWYELPPPEPEVGRAGLATARAELQRPRPRSDP